MHKFMLVVSVSCLVLAAYLFGTMTEKAKVTEQVRAVAESKAEEFDPLTTFKIGKNITDINNRVMDMVLVLEFAKNSNKTMTLLVPPEAKLSVVNAAKGACEKAGVGFKVVRHQG